MNAHAVLELPNHEPGQAACCRLSGTLDFNTAPTVLDQVSSMIDEHSLLVIDLTDVQHSNSAGLALMIEWLALARKRGHTVRFDHIPTGLRQLANVCQVDALI